MILQLGREAALLVFLLASLPSLGQYTIKGKISATDGSPLPQAVVVLQSNTNQSVLASALPDMEGRYELKAGKIADASLHVSAAGFAEKVVPLSDSLSEIQTMDLVLLPEDKQLKEVTVSATKPLFERKADRTIFNVANSITSSGGSAVDVLRKSPGVIVREQDNSIALAGKGGANVLINDKMMQLSGEDLIAYLRSIPSENIEKVEVITTPPAKYEAAGNSGLINIVLKKNKSNGLNGSARAGYQQASFGTVLGGGNLNYRKDKLNLYANLNYSGGSTRNRESLITYYPTQEYQLSDHYTKNVRSTQYTAGLDYQLHRSGLLGIEYTGSGFHRTDDPGLALKVVDRNSGSIDSTIKTGGAPFIDRTSDAVNINYVLDLDTAGKKLTLNANRLWYTSRRDRKYETVNYIGDTRTPTGTTSRNRNKGEQQIGITTAQADLELPFSWASVSAGGKLSFVDNDARNNFYSFIDGAYEDDPSVSNRFTYKERVQALYLSLSRDIGRWSIQAGLRGEFTQTEGYSVSLNQRNKNEYFNLFPTGYLLYRPNDNHSLNLNYSKRINRPGYADLDPFRFYNSPYSYIAGNPFLKPSFNHNLELGYSYKNKYNVTAYLQYERDHFGQVFLADSIHQTSYVNRANFGNVLHAGLYAMATLNPARWWETQLQGSAGIQQIRSSYYQDSEQEYSLPSFYVSCNNSLKLNRSGTLLAEVNAEYTSRNQWDLFYWEPRWGVDTGIRALFLDKRLTVSLNGEDIFATQVSSGSNQATGQEFEGYFDVRKARLMVNYRFGNKEVKSRRERSTGIEDERSRT